MLQTITLLDRALEQGTAAAWARKIEVERAAFTNARKAGRLSPVIAGLLAIELKEDVQAWMQAAVIEGEKDSPAKRLLAKRLSTMTSRATLYLRTLFKPTRRAK